MAMMEFTDRPLTVAVITVSDTRTKETDKGGARVEELAREAGFVVVSRQIVTDTIDEIQGAIHKAFNGNYGREVQVLTESTGNDIRAWTYEDNVGVADIMFTANTVKNATYQTFGPYLVAAAIYFVITSILSLLVKRLEKKLAK